MKILLNITAVLLLVSNLALALDLQRPSLPPAGGGACKGPNDCNAGNGQNCQDCSCQSSSTGMVCSCADGYVGPHCMVPMCNATFGSPATPHLHHLKASCDWFVDWCAPSLNLGL